MKNDFIKKIFNENIRFIVLMAIFFLTTLYILPEFVKGGTPVKTYEGVVVSKSQSESRGATSSHFEVEVNSEVKFFNVGNTKYTTFEIGDKILVTEYSLLNGLIKYLRYGTPEQNNQIVKVE